MFDIITSPLKAIESEKKHRSTGRTFGKLFVAALLIGIAALIVSLKITGDIGTSLMVLLGFAVMSFVGNLFNAWIYKLAIRIISGKGTYGDVLASLANAGIVMSTGLLLAMLLWLIPSAGVVLAVLVLIITIIISYAALIKSLTTFTGADLLSVVIGIVIVVFASLMAAYLVTAVTALYATILSQGGMMQGPPLVV